ncbi:MAG: ATP-binding cassette domain-containing protein [Alphaproteobacteria bacterium]|nr:ATP-binding cassette domain-containing protein [Alphaproteobacteria bacterium]
MTALELTDIRHSAGGREILRIPALSVAAGGRLLLLGPSGCGKTTLLNLMAGLLRAEQGHVSLNGQAYDTLSGRALDALRRKYFGIVFQKLHLIGHLSVEQNICLAADHPDKTYMHSLTDRLGIADKRRSAARNLSHGEAQRAAIARALMNRPAIVLADEPTSALDDAQADNVSRLLLDETQTAGAALIVATHDARIKPLFDTVLELAP